MFYNRFSELCKESGISESATIRALSLSSGNLKNWKNGRIPKMEIIEKIADHFGVSVDYLLGKTDKKIPLVNEDEELTEYLYYLKTRPELRMLFKVSAKATKADVEKAVKIIEALRTDDQTNGSSTT